jgi:menaquinone-specific isochorismate synthase
MDQETWYRLVADATNRIRRGDLDKVVLARARQMRFKRPVEPVTVLEQLASRYPDTYRFLVEPIPGHAFYGATPELLASVEGAKLRTVAMAGSIGRGQSSAEDDLLAKELMNNPKERHEHALVVDAIRENLAPLVSDLQLPTSPVLCRLSNIQHLETKIEGLLANNCGILPVVRELHPTPAVGGRPRKIALDIINNVEPTPRGWYAAPVGWVDHQGNGMFSVAIRSAVSVGGDSMLFAGAGIVADSVPTREWRETELKFRPLAEALGGVVLNGRAKS